MFTMKFRILYYLCGDITKLAIPGTSMIPLTNTLMLFWKGYKDSSLLNENPE